MEVTISALLGLATPLAFKAQISLLRSWPGWWWLRPGLQQQVTLATLRKGTFTAQVKVRWHGHEQAAGSVLEQRLLWKKCGILVPGSLHNFIFRQIASCCSLLQLAQFYKMASCSLLQIVVTANCPYSWMPHLCTCHTRGGHQK